MWDNPRTHRDALSKGGVGSKERPIKVHQPVTHAEVFVDLPHMLHRKVVGAEEAVADRDHNEACPILAMGVPSVHKPS